MAKDPNNEEKKLALVKTKQIAEDILRTLEVNVTIPPEIALVKYIWLASQYLAQLHSSLQDPNITMVNKMCKSCNFVQREGQNFDSIAMKHVVEKGEYISQTLPVESKQFKFGSSGNEVFIFEGMHNLL